VSLGLRLLAKLPVPTSDPEQLMQRIEDWVRKKFPNVLLLARRGSVETSPAMFCLLHPAAEEVELSLISPDRLVVSANTSTVGPGYHVFLASMLKDWAHDFHASWEQPQESSDDYGDETDYFFSGDEKSLFDNMASWLEAVANSFFDGSVEASDRGIALCMPIDPQYEIEASAITPLGPRGRDWLYETSQDGNWGKDFFAWWTPGFNAEYYLGRALAQMWSNVRWRSPVNHAEESILMDVASSLRSAYRLNPTLPYPWAEWQEILAFLDTDDDDADSELVRSHAVRNPTIGYRRRNVVVGLPGGWRMRVPGSFSDFASDNDNDNDLCAVDPPREIWFTSYQSTSTSQRETFESVKKEINQEGPEYLIEREDYIAKAIVTKKRRETGEDYFVLSSSNACLGRRSVCTILFSQPEERDWALDVWRSIQSPPNRESEV